MMVRMFAQIAVKLAVAVHEGVDFAAESGCNTGG